MIKVFISHTSEEKELAKYFADWLENTIPGTKCFCSSRPRDIPPGRDWFKYISENAKSSDLCLMLLSPFSAINNWLHFEVGLVLGSAELDHKKIIPVLYGGIAHSIVPPTVRHVEYLSLEDSSKFNAFISAYFLEKKPPSSNQSYDMFKQGLSKSAARILKYGEFGGWITEDVLTQQIKETISLKGGNDDSFLKKRINNSGELVAVRAKIIPRRIPTIQHWKFGITLLKKHNDSEERIFIFHSGCHVGLNSWSLYFSPSDNYPVVEPAKLEIERLSKLELWLTNDKASIACIGVDSDNIYKILMNDHGENIWRLKDNSWSDIRIAAWADGNPFHIDITSLEIDRIPHFDTSTLSLVGGMRPGIPLKEVIDRFGD